MDPKPKAKILLVDDNRNNLLALRSILSEYDAFEAYSGFEAIRLVEQEDFAAILLDVYMPVMDGYETAKRIKLLPQGRDIPIIFLTAVYQENEYIRKGYEVGGIDYLGKPFDPDVLRMKVGIYASLYLKAIQVKKLKKELEETQRLLADEHGKSGAQDGKNEADEKTATAP